MESTHGLPSQYIFMLVCYDKDFSHLVCQRGKPKEMPTWYKDGPPISHLSLHVLDVDRPWGNASCTSCKDFCSGHYLLKTIDTTDELALKSYVLSPSHLLKKEFSKLAVYPPPESIIEQLAQKALLTPAR